MAMATRTKRDTRERLLDAAMKLFAERGYAATTVGDIERAAGLAPRSGALYKYFAGKDELLTAALARELEVVQELGPVIEGLPPEGLREQLTLLARWNLESLSRREALNRFLARDADRLPPALRKKLYQGLVARPFDRIADLLRENLPAARDGRLDPEALALVFVQSMAGYRNMRALFGKVAGDVDDERFVRTWVEVALAVAKEGGAR